MRARPAGEPRAGPDAMPVALPREGHGAAPLSEEDRPEKEGDGGCDGRCRG